MPASDVILVVEDNQVTLALIRDSLVKAGFNVHTETNGFDALVAIDRDLPALVIADVMMPRLSGLDLLKATRNRTETSDIPFLLISALDSSENVQAGLALGATDYLTKPFKVTELLGKVRHYLRDRPGK
jgi:two-component system sensor histidine kinase ChiS